MTKETTHRSILPGAIALGLLIAVGLAALGWLLGQSALRVKALERTVTVKGLAEREFPADIVLWPIQFSHSGNDVGKLYEGLERDAARIRAFLRDNGIDDAEISISPPAIVDKLAQQYGGQQRVEIRYAGQQTLTVYSHDIDAVRKTQARLAELGKQGILFSGNDYQSTTEYLFTRLNEIKPEMIEQATVKAREVAERFARDSHSTLGKIRRARQGQFSISARDRNNPHIKKVRVVSTVEYYLSD